MGPPVKPYDLFRHKPLNLSENSFRLLDINGVSPEGLIECTINHYNRDDLHQSYSALSYTWGPETPAGWILLNGKAFRARENLIRFLEATSSHSEARKGIWIDAICIDQDNTTEKMQQVKQMDDIYRNAATVFAWLGDATGDYQELYELLKKFEETPEGGVPNRSSAIFGIVKGSSAVREQMLDVLSRQYWTRMWIIQEITLAQTDVRLLFGKHALSWNTVKPLSVMIKSDVKYRLFFRTVPAYQVAKAADLLRSKSRPLTILGLLKALDGGGLCADTRDKVYALLGMASDTGALEPDYTITGAELFFRVLESETSLVKTNTVTIDDVAVLCKAINVDFEDLRAHADAEGSHGHAEEFFRLKGDGLTVRSLHQHWNPLGSGVTLHCDYSYNLGLSGPLIDPLDIAFSFTEGSTKENLKRAVIIRPTHNGQYTYVAMAEWWDCHERMYHPWEVSDAYLKQCFFYGLPVLQSVQPFRFHVEDGYISLPANAVLYLTNLSEVLSVGKVRSLGQTDLRFLGIKNEDGSFGDLNRIKHRKTFEIKRLEQSGDEKSFETVTEETVS